MKKLMIVGLIGWSVVAHAATAYFVREVDTGGSTKQCIYDYLGSQYIRTMPITSLCPLTIQV